ncbi:MAG TPA: hypothetical protein VEQ09_10855 [Aquabacterium sp.]|nr:hypothetical protein [Aquabacterium sp.]
MALLRLIGLGLALAFLLCMTVFTVSGEPVWRQRAMLALRWLVVLGLGVIGLFVLRRAAVFI